MSSLRTQRFSRPAEVKAADIETESTEHVRPEPADWASLADDQVLRGEMRKKLVEALTHLPNVYRIPVLLRDIQGLSTEEASAVLRNKPQTLKSRLHRGRLILRKHLGDFAGGLDLHAREALHYAPVRYLAGWYQHGDAKQRLRRYSEQARSTG